MDADSTTWLNMIWRAVGNPYLGIFIISLLGNLALFFPVPYLLLIFTIALDTPNIGLILLTFLGALGATIGKLFSYTIGYGGGKMLGRKYEERFNNLRRLLGGRPFIAAFIFAASPLPDDLLFIPLGIMKYSLYKTFLACFAGKFLITFLTVGSGRVSRATINWIAGTQDNYYTIIFSIVVFIVTVVLMVKLDWGKVLLELEDKVKDIGSQ
ncbi:MAG: VTT domain-containing protein [Candidatus Bathyarchaeia archaeon]